MKINVLILFAWLPALLFAQNKPANNKLFERLQAITENKVDYYDVDGVTITCQVTQIPFSKENICKGLSIQESELKKSSPAIAATNFVFEQIDTLCGDILQYSTNYIVQNEKGNITHIIYMSVNKRCDELQQILTPLILEKKIPESVYNKKFFNTLNFAGRKIELGTYACGWTNVNCVQCPYHGEMSWSVHKDSADAALSVETQRYVTANCKMQAAQPTADEWVAVVFENQPLKARRITYRFEGETAALLLNTGGGNTHSLTIYYVVAPVRGNYVSCILSFWNNDLLEEASGLPSLLEKVMQLKEK